MKGRRRRFRGKRGGRGGGREVEKGRVIKI
jgi:hypothetical protein